jgi:hypothetical protein
MNCMDNAKCRMVTSQDLFNKISLSLVNSKPAVIIMVFLPHESLIKKKLSKNDEEKLILSGWKIFSENFQFDCYCTRLDWRSYFILLFVEPIEIVPSLKKIFNLWEQVSPSFLLWKIAFTKLSDSKEKKLDLIRQFECFALKTAHYCPNDKLFRVYVDEKLHVPIF